MIKDSLKNYLYEVTLNELHLLNHMEEWNISYNSLLYLDLINLTPNCTGSYLAEKLCVSKAAVTLKLNELLKQDLVIKRQSSEDRRVYYVEVSSRCRVYYKLVEKAMSHAISNVKRKYSEKEIGIFCNILDDMRNDYIQEMENEK